MTAESPQIDESLRPPGAAVDRCADRWRAELRGAIAERLAWRGLAAGASALWGALALDWLLEPSAPVRGVAIGFALTAGLAWLAVEAWCRLARPVTRRDAVALVHRQHPREAALLASSLELRSSGPVPPTGLAQETVALADAAAGGLAGLRLATPQRGSRGARLAQVAVAAAVIGAVLRPDVAGTFAARVALGEAGWPRRVTLVAEGFAYNSRSREWVRWSARGEPVDVAVVAAVSDGGPPPKVVWARGGLGGERVRSSLVRLGDPVVDSGVARQRFTRRVERLDDDFVLAVRGGDATLRLRVIAAERPVLTGVRVEVAPAPYLAAAPTTADVAALADVPEGSVVTISARSATPLSEASARVRRGERVRPGESPRLADGGRSLRYRAPPLDAPCVVTLLVTDAHGIASEPLEVALDCDADTPPSVSIGAEGVGAAVTRDAAFTVAARVADDHGVAAAGLTIVRGDGSVGVPLEPPTGDSAITRGRIDLLSLRSAAADGRLVVEPGDRLMVAAWVRDRYDLAPRGESVSAPIELAVVTPEELLARLGEAQREVHTALETVRSDVERLAYEVDLRRRRLDPGDPNGPDADRRWANDRTLDASAAARAVLSAADRAEGVARQVENNRLDQPGMVDRLLRKVVAPLRRVAEGELASATAALADATADGLDAALARASSDATVAADTLRRVAENLDTQQGYSEVVSLLRGLIREQERVTERTGAAQADAARRSLFD